MGTRERPGDNDVETALVLDWNVGSKPGRIFHLLGIFTYYDNSSSFPFVFKS